MFLDFLLYWSYPKVSSYLLFPIFPFLKNNCNNYRDEYGNDHRNDNYNISFEKSQENKKGKVFFFFGKYSHKVMKKT